MVGNLKEILECIYNIGKGKGNIWVGLIIKCAYILFGFGMVFGSR